MRDKELSLDALFSRQLAQKLSTLVVDPASPGRVPVAVTPRTRAFLEAAAEASNSSIAGVAGMILNAVAQQTELQSTSTSGILRHRVRAALAETGLSRPGVEAHLRLARILGPEEQLQDDTIDRLGSSAIMRLSKLLAVDYGWLLGLTDEWLMSSEEYSLWRDRPGLAAAAWQPPPTDLDLQSRQYRMVRQAPSMEEEPYDSGLFFFLAIDTRQVADCVETLTTYHVHQSGDWSKLNDRLAAKAFIATMASAGRTMQGLSIGSDQFSHVRQDYRAIRKIIRRAHTFTHHPEDYVSLTSANPMETDELHSEAFQALLATSRAAFEGARRPR